MTVTLRPRAIVVTIVTVATLLVVAHLAGLFSTYYLNHDHVFGLIGLFHLNEERNIPTYFSSALLLASATVLALIAMARRWKPHDQLHWIGLATIFLYLSVDEFAGLHERLAPLVSRLNIFDVAQLGWVIPYGTTMGVIGLVYARFLWNLPTKTTRMIVFSALLYATGAIGFEIIGLSHLEAQGGYPDLRYEIYSTIEETLEMGGGILFLYTLLDYVSNHLEDLRLRVASGESPSTTSELFGSDAG